MFDYIKYKNIKQMYRTFDKVQRLLPNSQYTVDNFKQIVDKGDMYNFLRNMIIDILTFINNSCSLKMYKKYFKIYDFYLNKLIIFKFEGLKISYMYFDADDTLNVKFGGIKISDIVYECPKIMNLLNQCVSSRNYSIQLYCQQLKKAEIYDKFKKLISEE